jgi:general secretion pathway protein E
MEAVAVASGASDLHVAAHVGIDDGKELSSAETTAVVRARLDGVLHEIARFDPRLLVPLVERWKATAGCDVREKGLPQDGRIITEVAAPTGRRRVDLRVSFIPSALGESMTVRVLDAVGVNLDLDRIPFAPRDRERLLSALRAPAKAIIVTGPTGCGKTTVIYAGINKISSPALKVMTVEDPVEYVLPWAVQIPVNVAAGRTFETALRGILRSDPDVIFVGEIRNLETLSLVLQASMTGHLVISTLHAADAVSALKRMVDIGVEPFMIAGAVSLVESQRLVRKLCPKCSVAAEPGRDDLDWAARAARSFGLDLNALPRGFRKAVGCPECARTGYKGRTIIAETLLLSPEIGAALERGASAEELLAVAVGQGMTTMAADGIRRAAEGETTLEEVLRVVG